MVSLKDRLFGTCTLRVTKYLSPYMDFGLRWKVMDKYCQKCPPNRAREFWVYTLNCALQVCHFVDNDLL